MLAASQVRARDRNDSTLSAKGSFIGCASRLGHPAHRAVIFAAAEGSSPLRRVAGLRLVGRILADGPQDAEDRRRVLADAVGHVNGPVDNTGGDAGAHAVQV